MAPIASAYARATRSAKAPRTERRALPGERNVAAEWKGEEVDLEAALAQRTDHVSKGDRGAPILVEWLRCDDENPLPGIASGYTYPGTMHNPGMITRKRIGFVLALVISASLVMLLLRRAPLDAILAVLSRAQRSLVAAGIVTLLVTPLLSAARTACVVRALDLPIRYAQVLQILLGTNFYSLFLPGTQLSGSLITLYRYRTLGAQVPRAALALGVSRLAEATAFVAIAGGILLSRIVPTWSAIAAGAAVAVAVVAFARSRAAARMRAPVALLVLGLAAVQVCVVALASRFLVRSLGGELSYANTLWITAGAYLVALLPISVAGLGVREGTLVALAGRYGVSAEQAVAWGLLLLAGRVAIASVGGLLELARVVAPPAIEREGADRRDAT